MIWNGLQRLLGRKVRSRYPGAGWEKESESLLSRLFCNDHRVSTADPLYFAELPGDYLCDIHVIFVFDYCHKVVLSVERVDFLHSLQLSYLLVQKLFNSCIRIDKHECLCFCHKGLVKEAGKAFQYKLSRCRLEEVYEGAPVHPLKFKRILCGVFYPALHD